MTPLRQGEHSYTTTNTSPHIFLEQDMAGRCYQPWRKCYEEFSVKKINHSMIPHRHLTNRTSQVWANSILEALPLQTPKIKPTKNYKSYQMLVYLHSAETVSFVNLKKNTEKLISMLASITVSSPANQVVQLVFMWLRGYSSPTVPLQL